MDELKRIYNCLVNMDEDNIIRAIKDAIAKGIPIKDIYEKGLNEGIVRVTELFDKKEYYIPEVIVCADILKKGIDYLDTIEGEKAEKGAKVVLAVVEGDHHEIGKNIVRIVMEASNFQVVDLGLNVKAETIIERAIKEKADIIGLSTMMTTTREAMREVVDLLNKEKSYNKALPKVIIGGGCVNQKYANEIACHGYAQNAVAGVRLVEDLLGGDSN